MKRLFLILFLLAGGANASGQRLLSEVYRSPLDIPIYLAASFGEIRPDHFHSGIDIKTQGVVGKPVRAVADGYVSRIGVSPYGYGHVLYIDHPAQGTTSVYGHLDRFADGIAAYVKKAQYERRSFSVSLYPPAGRFPVKQGELIAYSGNTGSSGGPHVHFEIRDTKSQSTLNTTAAGIYRVTDRIAPRIVSLRLIEVDTVQGVPVHTPVRTYPAVHTGGNRYRIQGDTLAVSKPSYFAVEVTDRKDGVNNVFGVYRVELTRSGRPVFGFRLDSFSFGETRYINTLTCYAETRRTRNDILRAYISPNNRLGIYTHVTGRGIVRPGSVQGAEPLRFDVYDDAGNRSQLTFSVTGSDRPSPAPQAEGAPVHWSRPYEAVTPQYQVHIPARALYESLLLDIRALPGAPGQYSSTVAVHHDGVPLQRSVTVRLREEGIPEGLRSRALIVRESPGGRVSSEGGQWKDGWVSAKVSRFGTFRVAVDSTPPRIVPRFKPGENLAAGGRVAFTVSDNLAGVSTWNGSVDGRWVLFEYDPKRALLWYDLDPAVTRKGGRHTVSLTVTDGKGNRRVHQGEFTW